MALDRLNSFGILFFMIELKRKAEVIEIKITNEIGWVITTEFKAPSEMYSILLSNSIDSRMRSELQRIRREAYEKGWKDAKSKNRKEDWFRGCW